MGMIEGSTRLPKSEAKYYFWLRDVIRIDASPLQL
jgi:hypothetical protein